MLDINKELESNQVILSIFPSVYYNESITELMKSLGTRRICYITLNKTASSMIKRFKSEKIKTNKIFFIDAISSLINPNKKLNNSLTIASPYALTELSIAISEALKSKKFDVVIFDSLSSLNFYNYSTKTTGEFVSYVINNIKSKKNKAIFTCIEDDEKSELIKESSMAVDKVIWFKNTNKHYKKSILTYSLVLLLLGLFSISFLDQNITGMAVVEEIPNMNPVFPVILTVIFLFGAIIIYINPLFSKKKKWDLQKKKEFVIKNKDVIRIIRSFRTKINNWT